MNQARDGAPERMHDQRIDHPARISLRPSLRRGLCLADLPTGAADGC